MNEWVVHKFGGSCLRTPSDIDRVHQRIVSIPGRPIIVVSALWGVTDRLLRSVKEPLQWSRLVNDLRKQHARFAPSVEFGGTSEQFKQVIEILSENMLRLCQDPLDEDARHEVLACGERLACIVVCEALRTRGLEITPVQSDDLGITISKSSSSIDLESTLECIDKNLIEGPLPLISGWFGVGAGGKTRVLKRGGSDLSAAALATILEAELVILWKDVPGVLSVSPRWGIDSSTISYLGYGEALALARAGGVVLHAGCIEPLRGTGIPLQIRPLNDDGPYTVIGPEINVDESRVSAISCTPGIVHYDIEAKANEITILLNDLMRLIEDEAVKVWALNAVEGHISLLVPSTRSLEVDFILEGAEVGVEKSEVASLVSLIGSGLKHEMPSAIATLEEKHAIHHLLEEDDLNRVISELANHHQLMA